MRVLQYLTLSIGLSVCAARIASATTIAEITDSTAPINSITLPTSGTNQTFTVNAMITTDYRAAGAQWRVKALDAPTIVFQLTGRTFDTAWNNEPLTFTSPDNFTVSGGRSQTIGSLAANLNTGNGPGTSRQATVNVVLKANTPAGTYKLNFSDIIVSNLDQNFIETPGTPGADYSVIVTPEPAAFVLLATGTALLARRRRT